MKKLSIVMMIALMAFMPAEKPAVRGTLTISGTAIKDIDVSLKRVPGSEIVANTKTDIKGNFVFESIEPDNYEIIFEGLQVSSANNNIGGKIQIGNKAVKSSDVHFYNTMNEQIAATVTDAKGNFYFEGITPGTVKVVVQLPSTSF